MLPADATETPSEVCCAAISPFNKCFQSFFSKKFLGSVRFRPFLLALTCKKPVLQPKEEREINGEIVYLTEKGAIMLPSKHFLSDLESAELKSSVKNELSISVCGYA